MRGTTKPEKATAHCSCRVCRSYTEPLLDFGPQYPVCFPHSGDPDLPTVPLTLAICTNRACALVQLTHTVPAESLFREYWYRSGINESMVAALGDIVASAKQRVGGLRTSDWVVDIGANDGTLLSHYGGDVQRCAFEPARNLAAQVASHSELVIHDFFPPPAGLGSVLPMTMLGRVKIITAIAMAYDLDDPNAFFNAIEALLAPDGLLVLQVGYLGDLLRLNSFDQACHEHLEYYSLTSLSFLLGRHGLVIEDISRNDVNGGSLRCYVRKAKSGAAPNARVLHLLHEEELCGMHGCDPYHKLRVRLQGIKATVADMLDAAGAVDLYGASTKGLTLMQYFGFPPGRFRACADRDERKWGREYGQTRTKIISEAEWRKLKPEVALVLPWHFKDAIVAREQDWLKRGGTLLFPLPMPKGVRG